MGKFIDKLIEKFASDIIDKKAQEKANKTVSELIKEAEKVLEEDRDRLDKERQELEEREILLGSPELTYKYNEFNDLVDQLKQDDNLDSVGVKLLEDMTEMGTLITSLENMDKELKVLYNSPEDNLEEIKKLEEEMMYALKRVQDISQEELFIYNAPIDEDTGEAQWVPYVFDNSITFVHYLLGRKLVLDPLIVIFNKMINAIRDEIDENGFEFDDEDSYTKHLFGMIDVGAFQLLFENVDFSMSSTKYTGLLPDGTHIDSLSKDDTIDLIGDSLTKMQPNSIADTIENGTVDIRVNMMNNLLNISCPFCGMPHEFKDVGDIPNETMHCTLCDKVLIQYTGNYNG